MESSKNDNRNNGGGDEQEKPQLSNNARKRKINQLANDGKPGGEEDQQGQEECSSSKNIRCDGNGKNDQELKIVQLPQPQVVGEKEIADENEEEAEAELPLIQPMKVQLSKETWFEMLTFVGRRQLGQLVTQVGDRRFARIAQAFLHNYGRITLASIYIYVPGHQLLQPAVAVPENVKDFLFISLSYLNVPVINLLQKFQQASLLRNVNLDLGFAGLNTLLQTLSHILPSLDNINSIRIRGANIEQLVDLENTDSEAAMAMLKMARLLDIYRNDCNFAPNEITFFNRWLHTPRDDGKPRVLVLPLDYSDFLSMDKIAPFIDDTIKSEFATAKVPICFFIRLFVRDTVEWHDSSMENGETKEKLVIKKVATTRHINDQTMALISRYPLAAGKQWIEANEREALDWNFGKQNCHICLGDPIINEM